VLGSFLGSGTTAAVEMGEQAKTHGAARLKKIIDDEQGGISKTAGWKGGGGFRFFALGEAVFGSGRRIKPDISFENLAAHIYFSETKTPGNQNLRRKQKNHLSWAYMTAPPMLSSIMASWGIKA
jgi:adenine-specific DNA-methyltransferase